MTTHSVFPITNELMFERAKTIPNVTFNAKAYCESLGCYCLEVTFNDPDYPEAKGLSMYSVIDGVPMELDHGSNDDWSPIVSAFSQAEADFIKSVFSLDVPIIPPAGGEDFYTYLDLKERAGYLWDQDVLKAKHEAVIVKDEADGLVSISNVDVLDGYAKNDVAKSGFSFSEVKNCWLGPVTKLPIRFIGNLTQSRHIAQRDATPA